MATPLAAFGPGILIVTRTDTTTPVAINVGYAQELNVDFNGTIKELFGQNQYALVAARGTIKATGKWKAATITGIAWNAAFYGATPSTTNNIQWNIGSTFTVSTSSSQLQVGSSLTFDTDLGITYGTTSTGGSPGIPLQRVTTGSEATGKYSITTGSPGLYNFAAGDQGFPIKVTYTNTTSAVGQHVQVTNQLIGTTPTFQLDYYTNLNQPAAKPFAVRLFACVAAKHVWGSKLEDYIMPEFDFSIFADNSGRVVDYYLPEIS
jgi:hypothetical protein